jgi:hypothetical protein
MIGDTFVIDDINARSIRGIPQIGSRERNGQPLWSRYLKTEIQKHLSSYLLVVVGIALGTTAGILKSKNRCRGIRFLLFELAVACAIMGGAHLYLSQRNQAKELIAPRISPVSTKGRSR